MRQNVLTSFTDARSWWENEYENSAGVLASSEKRRAQSYSGCYTNNISLWTLNTLNILYLSFKVLLFLAYVLKCKSTFTELLIWNIVYANVSKEN